MTDYTEIDELSAVYLEDSYVLGILEDDDRIMFDMEIVLTPDHPDYTPASEREQHCTRRGQLMFPGVTHRRWMLSGDPPATDATGKPDYGNIDTFSATERGYHLSGDWGELDVKADLPTILWNEEAGEAQQDLSKVL